ncbi:MAG: twin-arginine translocation signal domain-containing protein [Opitutus sp.]|nr:twin-arginine translocation signal domain-containing protein [Opitutus sp.]
MPSTRRTFLKTSLAASAAATLGSVKLSAAEKSAAAREYYELRSYRLKPGKSAEALDRYLAKALIPALNARGVPAVGVFTELDVDKPAATSTPKADSPVWVLIPHASLESFVSVSAALNTDATVQQAGADYLNAPKASPAFDRVDTWLYVAFTGFPKLAVPAFSQRRVPTRVFELRDYESHSELKALNKIAMFNAGEIEVMKDLGMSPVFYGQSLAGPNLPHLRYITGGPDLATHLGNWKKFGPHPIWAKLKDDPQYKDNTSKNTARFLAPTAYSQI